MEQEGRKDGRFEDGTQSVIGALIEVHRALGPGLLESAYEACLCEELARCRLRFARQVPLPVDYKGVHVDCGDRIDLVVEDRTLLELKAVDRLLPIHEAQAITYLRLGRFVVGLLVHFNVPVLRTAIRRLTPNPPQSVPVGTALSGRPPDRTRRADFPHRAPTSGQRVAKRLSGQG